MKIIQEIFFKLPLCLAFFFLTFSGRLFAQMPNCNNIYIHAGDGSDSIFTWNSAMPFSVDNPSYNTIAVPGTFFESNGLAIAIGVNATIGSTPTFYTNFNGNYNFYNGATWVNTGHACHASNMGGGVGVVYAFDGVAGTVYKYNGTGDDVPLITIPDFNSGGPFDIVADCANNFYILKQTTPSPWLRKYSPAGVLLQQWTVNGAPDVGSGGSFAILENTLYTSSGGLFAGTIGNTVINLTEIQNVSLNVFGADYASCPLTVQSPPPASFDTIYPCSASANIISNGSAPYSYQILNGSATVTSAGANFTVTPTGVTTIVLKSTGSAACSVGQPIRDTFTIVPAPKIDAGTSDTLEGCGNFTGTLHAILTNNTSWINYNLNWTPTANVVTGSNTLMPAIAPIQNTYYKLTVSTDNLHGHCSVSDSVLVVIKNLASIPDFSYVIKKGCKADSVIFTNQSQNALGYNWDFGDGSATDTGKNPIHVFNTQGIYNVKLTTNNDGCTNNVVKNIDTKHPLVASFGVSKEIICQGSAVSFNNTSTVGATSAIYQWYLGDGTQSNTTNIAHTYNNSGVYNAMLVVSDAIPCFDTAYHTITVDSFADVKIQQSSYNICTGESVDFNAISGNLGDPQFTWNFNDGSAAVQTSDIAHAYDRAGKFKVELTSHFRACPDVVLDDSVVVNALPIVNLGPDTALCLDGKAIPISNLEPSQPGDQFVWNTGETTAATLIKHPGIYKLTVTNAAGCVTSDEVDVKKDCYIDVPNSFTPNNDGVNDYFFPRQELSEGVAGFTMQVFDRWGEKIFETTKANGRGWDGKFNGKDQPQGVYIYIINVVLKNGRTEHYTGNVTLLR
jgi:gliding motility-associated-like protein